MPAPRRSLVATALVNALAIGCARPAAAPAAPDALAPARGGELDAATHPDSELRREHDLVFLTGLADEPGEVALGAAEAAAEAAARAVLQRAVEAAVANVEEDLPPGGEEAQRIVSEATQALLAGLATPQRGWVRIPGEGGERLRAVVRYELRLGAWREAFARALEGLPGASELAEALAQSVGETGS